MSAVLTTARMTQDEFLEWSRRDGGRWWFDGFQPVAMTNGSLVHGRIAENIRYELNRRLRGGPCWVMSSDGPGIGTQGGKVRFPEATVLCGPVPTDVRLLPNPVVIFEVVSPGSARTDQVDKMLEYQLLPSVRSYVVVEQTAMLLTVHSRDDAGRWTTNVRRGAEALVLPEIGVEIAISDFYFGTDVAA